MTGVSDAAGMCTGVNNVPHTEERRHTGRPRTTEVEQKTSVTATEDKWLTFFPQMFIYVKLVLQGAPKCRTVKLMCHTL